MKRVWLLSFLLISTKGFGEDMVRKLLPMTTGTTSAPTFTSVNYSVVPDYMREEREIVAFIENNMDTLRVEVAQGEGEHLDTLESYLDPAYPKRWRGYLQENFEEIFGSEKELNDAQKVFDKMDAIVQEKFERKRV